MDNNGAAMAIGGLINLGVIVFMITSMMGIFIKADKPWWAALVPIYNLVVMLEIVGKPIWWLVLWLIPVVNFVATIMVSISLAKSFGKDTGFAVGLIFLGFIFLPILAFGDSRYVGPDS